jgi:peptidyl-prolyl cis-trans isomerase D
LDAISITDEEVQSFYEGNKDQFMADEQLVVEYLELRPDDLVQEVVVEESVVNDVIEARINAVRAKQSRQVAQILLEKQDDGSHLDKISDIQKQLEAGEEFAVLAEQHSEDYSTAEQGGDLGFVQRGDLPEPLSVALDSLSVGEISGPVETELGVHLVKLLSEKKAELPSRDDIEPGIRRELQRQLALELLPERIEELKDLSYNASSLESVADRLDLTLQITEPFSRNGGDGIAGKPQVITAAFSEPVLEKGLTSEVLDLADDHVVVLSLRERIPSRLKPLTEVRPRIEQILKKVRADRQLMERAETLVARVKGGESIEEVAKHESLQWQVNLNTKRFSGKLNEEIRQWVFSLAEPADSAVVSDLALANGDHVVVSLTRVTEGDFNKLSAEQKQVLSTTVALTAASRDYQAYETLLVEQADIASKY